MVYHNCSSSTLPYTSFGIAISIHRSSIHFPDSLTMHLAGASVLFVLLNYAAARVISTGAVDESTTDIEKDVDNYSGLALFSIVPRASQIAASCDKCKRCKKNRIQDKKDCSKCVPCPPSQKPDPNHRICIPDHEDQPKKKCSGKQVPNPQGTCADCSGGYKPDPTNKKCIPDKTGNDEDRKKGKCKDKDFILDPAQGGQDENTENPACTYDDDKKCKTQGKTAVTRSPKNVVQPKDADSYGPVCGKDTDPNFRCKDKNTYHHKEQDDNDNIKHSCRATREKKKQQRQKYNERVNTAKEQKSKSNDRRKQAHRENSRRTRVGFCFTLLAGLDAWDLGEIESMPADDMDGLMELWPETDNLKDVVPTYLDDSMVHITTTTVNFNSGQLAGGFPLIGLAGVISRVVAPLGRAVGNTRIYTALRSGSRSRASSGAIKSAKNSNTVGKLLKDKKLLDCLAAAPALAGKLATKMRRQGSSTVEIIVSRPGASFIIDPNSPYYNPKIAPPEFDNRQIVVSGMVDTKNLNNNVDASAFMATYPDKIGRPGRLEYETCQQLPGEYKNKLTAVAVDGGCCAWYADSNCNHNSFLFAMTNRSDYKLKGEDNDNAEAIWCTFDDLCKSAPGVL
jgi:hypothetical protein